MNGVANMTDPFSGRGGAGAGVNGGLNGQALVVV